MTSDVKSWRNLVLRSEVDDGSLHSKKMKASKQYFRNACTPSEEGLGDPWPPQPISLMKSMLVIRYDFYTWETHPRKFNDRTSGRKDKKIWDWRKKIHCDHLTTGFQGCAGYSSQEEVDRMVILIQLKAHPNWSKARGQLRDYRVVEC